jgi:hypothetical protein
MADRITSLCARLLKAEVPTEIRPVADDLRSAIHEHIDKVRETACQVLLLDRVVNSALRRRREIRKRRQRPEYWESKLRRRIMNDRPLKPSDSEWQQLAEQASKETDPEKVSQLIRLLCDRLDELDRIRKERSVSPPSGPNGGPGEPSPEL